MAKLGEINYLKNMDTVGIVGAVNKPFAQDDCVANLQEIAAVFSLLPPPPARVLDLGCGTGWTSRFLAQAGYQVVGADISPDMIYHAEQQRRKAEVDNLNFVVRDYEEMDFCSEFDAVLFYDSLHHAVDEELALRKAFEALRPGGVCITSEPGEGHENSPAAVHAMEKYGVTEKDMPPAKIMSIGKALGFQQFSVYPYGWCNLIIPYARGATPPLAGKRLFADRSLIKRACHWLIRTVLGVAVDTYAIMLRNRPFLREYRSMKHGAITCMVK